MRFLCINTLLRIVLRKEIFLLTHIYTYTYISVYRKFKFLQVSVLNISLRIGKSISKTSILKENNVFHTLGLM